MGDETSIQEAIDVVNSVRAVMRDVHESVDAAERGLLTRGSRADDNGSPRRPVYTCTNLNCQHGGHGTRALSCAACGRKTMMVGVACPIEYHVSITPLYMIGAKDPFMLNAQASPPPSGPECPADPSGPEGPTRPAVTPVIDGTGTLPTTWSGLAKLLIHKHFVERDWLRVVYGPPSKQDESVRSCSSPWCIANGLPVRMTVCHMCGEPTVRPLDRVATMAVVDGASVSHGQFVTTEHVRPLTQGEARECTLTAKETYEVIEHLCHSFEQGADPTDMIAPNALAKLRAARGDAIISDPPRCAGCEAPIDLADNPRLATCHACGANLSMRKMAYDSQPPSGDIPVREPWGPGYR